MLKFPKFVSQPEPTPRRLSLREYAHFSELCLRSNPHITAENCLTPEGNATGVPVPFRFPPEPET